MFYCFGGVVLKDFGRIKRGSIVKPISLTLTLSMLLPLCSCSEEPARQSSFNYQWVDSNLFENLDEMSKADLKDDYAAAVNYEWSAAQTRDFTYRIMPFGDVERTVVENKRAIIEDETVQGTNIELIRTADELFCDWEYRDSLGVEPLKKYLTYIEEIKTLDDVSAYMLDNDKNPFAFSLVSFEYSYGDAVPGYRSIYFVMPGLVLENYDYYYELTEDSYKEKEEKETQIRYLLDRCGYSEKEIDRLIDGCFSFESKMAYLNVLEDNTDFYTVYSREEVLEKAGSYPLEELLDHYSITDCDYYSGEVDYVDEVEKIYTESNVEDIKAFFMVHLALSSIKYLDAGAYDCYMNSQLDRTSPFAERIDKDSDYNFFEIIRETPLTAAMDQAYIDYYYNEDTYNEIVEYIHVIREKYEILINSNEYLSDESKKAVCEKLNKMGENVFKPSNTADFTGVELKSKADGGTYLDALCVLNKLKFEHYGEVAQMYVGRAYWDIYDPNFSTTMTNAFYLARQNSIYINIGIMDDPIYSPDDPFERKLAYVGTVLGHEISHAFDSGSIYYDADGNKNDIVSKDELSAWTEMSAKIALHLSSFEPFEGSGRYTLMSNITGETIADIEGVKVCLLLAKEYENFDYDLFFRSYADHWRRMDYKSNQMLAIKTDTHPLPYLRCNYTLMQIDEFYETYDIKPGDGMYLAPDERISIW